MAAILAVSMAAIVAVFGRFSYTNVVFYVYPLSFNIRYVYFCIVNVSYSIRKYLWTVQLYTN